MNKLQKVITAIATASITLTMLFPPFVGVLGSGTTNLGYSFLLHPPEFGYSARGIVNVPTLLVEWAAILLVAATLWWLSGKK